MFQGKYDIGDAGMRYFTIGFVSTMQVYPGREGREGDARERGMWEREMRYKERGREGEERANVISIAIREGEQS